MCKSLEMPTIIRRFVSNSFSIISIFIYVLVCFIIYKKLFYLKNFQRKMTHIPEQELKLLTIIPISLNSQVTDDHSLHPQNGIKFYKYGPYETFCATIRVFRHILVFSKSVLENLASLPFDSLNILIVCFRYHDTQIS